MKPPRSRLKELVAGKWNSAPLVDLGVSSLTGIRVRALPHLRSSAFVAHPIIETLALEPADCVRLGSDCVRAGMVFEPPRIEDKQYVDAYCTVWSLHQDAWSPLNHPLASAQLEDIRRHPKPQ